MRKGNNMASYRNQGYIDVRKEFLLYYLCFHTTANLEIEQHLTIIKIPWSYFLSVFWPQNPVVILGSFRPCLSIASFFPLASLGFSMANNQSQKLSSFLWLTVLLVFLVYVM